MADRSDTSEFPALLQALADGVCTAAEHARLEAILLDDADARATYREYMAVHAALTWRMSPGGRGRTVKAETVEAEALESEVVVVDDLAPAPAERLRYWEVAYDFISHYTTLALLISGLTITIIVLSLALWIVPESNPAGPAPTVISTEFVARITTTQQASFDAASDGNFQNRDLFDDDTIMLTTGMVTIEYDTGARVVLEAPATYHIAGVNAGDLRLGKLVARVDTPQSQGFAVDIPGGRIVDLGTEFGAEVSADGNSQVAVLSGLVELTGNSRPEQRVRLTAGEAAAVDSTSGEISVERDAAEDLLAAFRGQLKMTPTEPAAKASRGGLVAYWPLNDGPAGSPVVTANDVIDDPSHPATDAKVEGTGETWVRDPERGIVVQTTDTGNLIAGTQGIDGDFTWSLWIKTNDESSHVIMGNRGGSPSRWNRLTPTFTDDWAHVGDRLKGTSFGVADGDWHHMVYRRAGGEVSVWVDGEPYPQTARQSASQNGPLRIGGDGQFEQYLNGLLSDVAIWTRALSVQEIKALASGGSVESLGDEEK